MTAQTLRKKEQALLRRVERQVQKAQEEKAQEQNRFSPFNSSNPFQSDSSMIFGLGSEPQEQPTKQKKQMTRLSLFGNRSEGRR